MMSRSLLLPLALLVSTPVLAEAPAAPTSQREVADFQGVAVGYGIRAEVKPGAKSVRLEGSAEDVARVKLVVKDGVLRTQMDRDASWSSKGLKSVRLYVTNPRVESVSASGGAHVDAQATAASSFEVEASGGSEVKVSGVESKKLNAEASGGSQITLQGRADEVEAESSGGSGLHARGLKTSSIEVEASGGSTIETSADQRLSGSLSGGSTITSASKPANVQVSRSGGSQVRYE